MNFKKTTLPNGLRVITAPNLQSTAATVLVLVEAGSNYEQKEINGLSHFLEHMCFKGTEKRPTALDISSELDSLGAQYNAFTSNEYTGYYAKVQAGAFDTALDIVSDLYLNPTFKAEEVEKEKGVIIEEINMYEDLPQRRVQELVPELLYGDQPAGWGVAGRKEVIRALSREDFIAYRDKHYVASATIIVVAGNFDESTVYDKISQHFVNIPTTEKGGKLKTVESQTEPKVLLQYKESDQSHLVVAVRGYDAFHPDHYILEVMASILGGGMSSRLFQKVREEMGAAYYVNAGNDGLSDHGYFAAAAGADNSKAPEVVRAIVSEMARLRDEAVTDKELKMVKDMIVGNLFLSLETSDHVATFFGGQEVLRRAILTPDQIAEKIRSVTAADISRVAKDIFKKEHLNLAMIGPSKDSSVFVPLLTL